MWRGLSEEIERGFAGPVPACIVGMVVFHMIITSNSTLSRIAMLQSRGNQGDVSVLDMNTHMDLVVDILFHYLPARGGMTI